MSLKPLTTGPAEHFFGYFTLCPWNAPGTHMAVHRTTTTSPIPGPDEAAEIMLIERDDYSTARVVGVTTAWNWQQGSALQWVGDDPNRVIYNRRTEDARFVARVQDVRTGEHHDLDRAIYGVCPTGARAYSVDFARLHFVRPGYGYTVGEEARRGVAPGAPADDGLWVVDLERGTADLMISLHRLVWTSPHSSMTGAIHWVDHVQPSPDGAHVAFLHRWSTSEGLFFSRLMVSDAQADRLVCLENGGGASHYDWRDDRTIVGWFRPPRPVNRLRMASPSFRRVLQPLLRVAHAGSRLLSRAAKAVAGDGYFSIDVSTEARRRLDHSPIREDGHCAISPCGQRMIIDTYPDQERIQRIYIHDFEAERTTLVAEVPSPARFTGAYRCDLHARWSRDGRTICFDSTRDGARQVYTLDLGAL